MKLYVGNFAYTTTELELRNLFAKQGSVLNVRIIHDQFTRQSKCFGYVKMSNMQEGRKAIASLNGKTFNDQQLVVKKNKENLAIYSA